MTAAFRADRRGRPTAVFDPVEVTLLRGLVAQLVELVEDGHPVASGQAPGWAAEFGLEDLGVPGPSAPPEDAVLRRLLPDAYSPDSLADSDPEAAARSAAQSSAEFRRLTENGLRRTKSGRARLVLAALAQEVEPPPAADQPAAGLHAGELPTADRPVADRPVAGRPAAGLPAGAEPDPVTVRLDPDHAQAWLTVLTDLRLALATRLGIATDADAADLENLARAELSRLRRARRRVRRPRDNDEPQDARIGVYQVYSWLGYLQESLVDALSRPSLS